MTVDEVKQTFADLIEDIGGEEMLILRSGEDTDTVFTPVTNFVEVFAECELTYDSLKTHSFYLDSNWGNIIDGWKDSGYIK